MVFIRSLGESVLGRLSYEDRNFLEKEISSFSDKAKAQVDEILGKLSEEERVARVNKVIARANESNRIRKERNLLGLAKLTPLSFLSYAEMKGLCGIRKPTEKELREMELIPKARISKFELPSSFDWRVGNWMTPIKNQGQCGSCWAFATLGAIEAKEKIMQNNPNLNMDLSEQDLISCSDAGSCNGGLHYPAYAYAKDNGVVYEDCFSYLGCKNWGCLEEDAEGNCIRIGCLEEYPCNLCSDWENNLYKINTFTSFFYQDLRSKIILYGPITFAMEIRTDFYDVKDEIYVPGPISETNKYLGGHAMIIVGYNDDEEYWIVKNSWGTIWGDEGYGKISYDAHDEIFFDYLLYLSENTPIIEPEEPEVQVTINYTITAKNIKNPHDIIVGASIFTQDLTWVADLPWWVIVDPTDNMEYTVPLSYSLGLTGGDYILRARAWKDYDLIDATEIDRTTTPDGKWVYIYTGGYLYNQLDEEDGAFIISPPEIVSANIINVTASLTA